MADDIPSTLSNPSDIDLQIISKQLGPEFFEERKSDKSEPAGDASSTPTVEERALTLALFGWEAEAGHINGLAVCQACFRRLGLWLFKPTPKSPREPGDGEAAMSRLDVVAEHRDYCPWVNPLSQSGDATPKKGSMGLSGLAGWEILARLIRNRAHLNERLAQPPSRPQSGVTAPEQSPADAVSVVDDASTANTTVSNEVQDKERWAKLKKLRQVFHVKDSKRLSKAKSVNAGSRNG